MIDLSGKSAIVTGAGRGGRGIGRGIALALAEAGADVAITARTSIVDAESVADAVRGMGRKSLAIACDVADSKSVEALFEKVKSEWGRVDILVNNAGITRDTLILRMSEDDWDAVLDANLKGAFLCTRAAAKLMIKQRWGRIVNIFVDQRAGGKPRSGELLREQGRPDRTHPDGGARTGDRAASR